MAAPTNGSLYHTAAVPPSTTNPTPAQAAAAAHTFNPENLDLIQILNQGGKVVWAISNSGVAVVNPTTPSKVAGRFKALLAQFSGASFAAAFSNPSKLDVYQVHNGSKVVFHVDSTGAAFQP